MLISLYPQNIDLRKVESVAKCLSNEGVAVVPTDSVYAFACSISGKRNYQRLLDLKEVKKSDATFSISFLDYNQLSQYVNIDNTTFRFMKRNETGIFTYILPTNKKFPEQVLKGRTSFGVKINHHPILQVLLEQLNAPLVTASVKNEADECMTEPAEIYELYERQVDIFIDAGTGNDIMSTLIDCTTADFPVIRQGVSSPLY